MSARGWAVLACGKAAPLLLLALAGCTQTHVEARPDGSFTLDYTRSATSAAVTLTLPDGSRLDYSSEPQTAAVTQLADLISRLLAVAAAAPVAARNSGVHPQRYLTPLPTRLQSPEPALSVGGPT